MRKPTLLKALLPLALIAAACAPPWTVVRQANPNPFQTQRSFAVEAIRFDTLQVGGKTEAEYLAGKDPKQLESWAGDKAEMSNLFASELAANATGLTIAPPGPTSAIVRPSCSFVEPGNYNSFVNISTEVRLVLQILDASGQVQDEIETHTSVPASIFNPASGGRMRTAAKSLGKNIATYLAVRAGTAK